MDDQRGVEGTSQVEKDGNVTTVDQLGSEPGGEEASQLGKDGKAETE